jgi:poly(hydroxyalkanoate) granule-associated protein
MARKGKNPGNRKAGSTSEDFSRAAADSAQTIWLAGLGAFERARSEGPKMFETLVEQGKSIGGRAREAADQALRNLRDGAADASGRFDKLEQVFEERVSRSLQRLGVLTRGEMADLTRQVDELSESVRQMASRQPAGAKRAARGTARKARRGAKKAKAATRGSRARRA